MWANQGGASQRRTRQWSPCVKPPPKKNPCRPKQALQRLRAIAQALRKERRGRSPASSRHQQRPPARAGEWSQRVASCCCGCLSSGMGVEVEVDRSAREHSTKFAEHALSVGAHSPLAKEAIRASTCVFSAAEPIRVPADCDPAGVRASSRRPGRPSPLSDGHWHCRHRSLPADCLVE